MMLIPTLYHFQCSSGAFNGSGKDATRAFISGDFSSSGLVDDMTGLGHEDFLGIEEWLHFYGKQYTAVGVLEGTYYDSKGRPTRRNRDYMKALNAAKKWKAEQHRENEKFPPCNSEWDSKKGSRVWCSNKSGGIQREWTGLPRKLFKPGSSQARCVCVRDSGPPSEALGGASTRHRDTGDLDHPNLQTYDGCHPSAVSCATS